MKYIEIEDELDQNLKIFMNKQEFKNVSNTINFFMVLNSFWIDMLTDEEMLIDNLKGIEEKVRQSYLAACHTVREQILKEKDNK